MQNPHFLWGNEGCCDSVSTVDSEPPLGFEPRTYALRKHPQQAGFSVGNECFPSLACPKAGREAADSGCNSVSIREDERRSELVVPPELVVLMERWPMLPETVRRVVLALVDGSLPKPIEAALLALLESVR